MDDLYRWQIRNTPEQNVIAEEAARLKKKQIRQPPANCAGCVYEIKRVWGMPGCEMGYPEAPKGCRRKIKHGGID